MKVLVICQYYYPEPFRISDLCEELVKQHHDLTVIAGVPNYPMGEIYPEYRHKKKRDEVINGVKVHRCFTIGRKGGVIKRFLNYFSFAISSTRYVSRLKEDFDIVFVNQLSPVMMANAGIRYKKKHHKKLILYCLDLWPESLIAGGISRKSLIYKLFHGISSRIYRQADEILITSQSFEAYLSAEFDISHDKIKYLPQYAEELFSPISCKKEPNNTIDLLFAGNIGAAQSVDTIIRAANETKDIKNLRWHVVGDGSELKNCMNLAKDLEVDTVIFHGRKALEEMPKYYGMADAMVVTMKRDPIISMTLPGKVQTYMAAGKPIIGAIDGETAKVIKEARCGFCGEAENIEQFVQNIRLLLSANLTELSQNASDYYQLYFVKTIFMKNLLKELSGEYEHESTSN